jgi:VCBS repeat-containing protein
VLFDNHSTVTIDPVFDSAGQPRPDVAFDMAPDRTLTGEEFASLFPITTDQSILPAAGTGGNGPTAGAHFGDPSVDPLTVGTPLALLGPGPGPGSNFASLPTETPTPTHAPTATPDAASVVEAGVNPANVPFAGTPITTGNVLTNDVTVDPGAVKTVIGVAVGAGSTPSGSNIGATLTGSYGTLVLGADGSYTYTVDNTNTAGKALAQGQHASDVFTYTMSDSLGHNASTTLTIDVIGTNDQPVIASGAESSSLAELPNTTGSSTHDTTLPVPTGTLNFTDVNLADTHSLGVVVGRSEHPGRHRG